MLAPDQQEYEQNIGLCIGPDGHLIGLTSPWMREWMGGSTNLSEHQSFTDTTAERGNGMGWVDFSDHKG